MIKTYYLLTKPGIILGNAITVIAAFLLASKGHVHLWLLLSSLLGISFVMASSCVFNNYIDRDIDSKMQRTKNRALVKKLISGKNAIIYAIILGIIGFAILLVQTNLLTVLIGCIAVFVYVVLYGIWKRRSPLGTIIGSIAGATPPVAGYCAVTNRFDMGAILLGTILILWQMPHFYAIAIYRLKEYAAASIPVLPVKKGIFFTKIYMVCYIIAFCFAISLLTIYGFTGYGYLLVVGSVSLGWLGFAIWGFWTKNTVLWARKMFVFSLVVIFVLCLMIAMDALFRYYI